MHVAIYTSLFIRNTYRFDVLCISFAKSLRILYTVVIFGSGHRALGLSKRWEVYCIFFFIRFLATCLYMNRPEVDDLNFPRYCFSDEVGHSHAINHASIHDESKSSITGSSPDLCTSMHRMSTTSSWVLPRITPERNAHPIYSHASNRKSFAPSSTVNL